MEWTISRAAVLWLMTMWSIFSISQAQDVVRSRISDEWRPRSVSGVCDAQSCRLPDCYCSGQRGPAHLHTAEVPQMVMLTFDDAVNEQVFDYYKSLLKQNRRNPNGCRIPATFYVSHNWTDYRMVGALYEAGHELASHTVSHRLPQAWWGRASLADWTREVGGQKDNLIHKAGVPGAQVRGMRAPFLELGGDKQFRMMSQAGLTYDSSFMTGPYDRGGAWPFTLDYPPNWRYCSNNNCPKSSFPGMWELPMNRWVGPDGKPCSMVDACQSQPLDHEDALGYMWYNFNRFYRGNRAPFGIHLHAVWFRQDPTYLKALDTFIDALTDMDDVYFVTASQVIDWMKDPTPLQVIQDFSPWKRSCKENIQRNSESVRPDNIPEQSLPRPTPFTLRNQTTIQKSRQTTSDSSETVILADRAEDAGLHYPESPHTPERHPDPHADNRQPTSDQRHEGIPSNEEKVGQIVSLDPEQRSFDKKVDQPKPHNGLKIRDRTSVMEPSRQSELNIQQNKHGSETHSPIEGQKDQSHPTDDKLSQTNSVQNTHLSQNRNKPGHVRNSASKEQVSSKEGPRTSGDLRTESVQLSYSSGASSTIDSLGWLLLSLILAVCC